MSIDSKKFIATVDGTSICLFPERLSILHRQCGVTNWTLDIDKGVDKALALLIFGEYHTTMLRWHTKAEALDALNRLLEDEDPETFEDTDWELEEVLERYHIWIRIAGGRELFNCTITNCPPQTGAGYADRAALLKLKGIGVVPGFEG